MIIIISLRIDKKKMEKDQNLKNLCTKKATHCTGGLILYEYNESFNSIGYECFLFCFFYLLLLFNVVEVDFKSDCMKILRFTLLG